MSLTLKLSLVAVALVLVLGGVVFAFGTPQSSGVAGFPAMSEAEAAVTPPVQQPATEMVAEAAPGDSAASPMGDVTVIENAEVPEPDPNVPLAIEIPGCRCHSDDPKIVEEHSKYRMNQCFGCHGEDAPTGM